MLAVLGDLVLLLLFLFIFWHGVMLFCSESVDEESDTSTVTGVSESGSSLTVVVGFCETGDVVVLGVPIKVLWEGGELVFCAAGSRLSGWEGGGVGGLVRGLGIGWDEGGVGGGGEVGWGWGWGGLGGAVDAGGGGAVFRALFAYERGQSRKRCPLTPQRLQGLGSRHALVSCSSPHVLHLTSVQAAAK